MSGTNPKYLPIPKKVPYNIRLPKNLLDSFNAYAELTGNTTTDVVIGALNDFIKDKTVYNDYLPDVKGITIRIPILRDEIGEFINNNLIEKGNGDSAYDVFDEIFRYSPTTLTYEILKIPNNLDRFNSTFGYVTPAGNVIGKGKHSGIEFVVIPEAYTIYPNTDVSDTLFCLYFEVEMDKIKSVSLITYLDAINKANDVGNVNLKNKIISCITDLKNINYSISPYDDVGDGVELQNTMIDNLEAVAKKYNTGNIIPLGENIDSAVVTAKVNENPELYDEFMDDIKGNTERYVDEVIAERFHNIMNNRLSEMENKIKNAKSKDEILSAISESKIITKK